MRNCFLVCASTMPYLNGLSCRKTIKTENSRPIPTLCRNFASLRRKSIAASETGRGNHSELYRIPLLILMKVYFLFLILLGYSHSIWLSFLGNRSREHLPQLC